jgi:hypothetical protein
MRKLYEKPTPGHALAIPTKDEFITWCESPVTQFVALAYDIGAKLQKEDWLRKSWDAEKADILELVKLKSREDAYKAFLECEYEAYLKIVEAKSPLK